MLLSFSNRSRTDFFGCVLIIETPKIFLVMSILMARVVTIVILVLIAKTVIIAMISLML